MKLFFYSLCIPMVLIKTSFAVDALQYTTPVSQANFNNEYGNNGREYKLKEIEKTANQGAGAAAAAGAALTAVGVPMSLSPILPVQLAGIDLLIKAGLEFGQVAEDKASAANHGAQNALIRSEDNMQASAVNEKAKVGDYLPQEFKDMLQQQGVDPNTFINQLNNNEFKSAQDALAALGKTDISPADIAQGAALAEQETMKVLSTVHAALAGATVDENKNTSGVAASGAANGSNPSIIDHLGNKTTIAAPNNKKGNNPSVALQTATGGTNARNLASNLFGQQPSQMAEVAQLRREQYLNMGVQAPTLKQNIFQVARRQFRNFSKWQKEELDE
jgi:hypothetical protein